MRQGTNSLHASSSSSRNRNQASNMINTIDAAALQSEMAKKYGIQGMKLKKSARPAVSSAISNQPIMIYCQSCGHNTPQAPFTKIEYCEQCGVFIPLAIQHEESLASRRGLLVELPPKPAPISLKPLDWYLIESSIQRKSDPDSSCPICMESFGHGEEVLLSCSHIFHKICLRSFENFMKTNEFACPICRTKNYQKKMTYLGYHGYERNCARIIQKYWRGYQTRKEYKLKLRRYYKSGKGNSILRQKYYEKEFSTFSNHMDKSIETRANQVNDMLKNMDTTLIQSRQLDLLFDQMLTQRIQTSSHLSDDLLLPLSPSQTNILDTMDQLYPPHPVNDPVSNVVPYFKGQEFCIESNCPWQVIFDQAANRGSCDCVICMQPIQLTNIEHSSITPRLSQELLRLKKPSILLNCSHLFHESCIQNFEKFARGEKCCPVCRSYYIKRLLP